jgi:hypothetical protein
MASRRIHQRDYHVEGFEESDNTLRVVGRVHDQRPFGIISGDSQPLTVHDMTVELVVDIETLRIISCRSSMAAHPHDECPAILTAYKQIEGLSVMRGYTNAVRERLGGPRGCTHITALLIAMGPVITQSLWSLRWARVDVESARAAIAEWDAEPRTGHAMLSPEQMDSNRNTCHVWADEIVPGDPDESLSTVTMHTPVNIGTPIWARERLERLGLPPDLGRSLDRIQRR